MKFFFGCIAGLCLLLIIVSQSIFISTFHMMPYFRWHYNRRDIPNIIGMEKEELMYVTTELLEYMRGRRDDLIIYATVQGEHRQFFSEIEIRHMVDVLDLYNIGFMIRNISFWMFIFAILGMAYFKMHVAEVLARWCRGAVVVFLALLLLLTAGIALDFDRAFLWFHLIFFDNDYWILDPRVDLLINMVPQVFFVEISIIIGAFILLFSAVVIGASTIYLKLASPDNFNRVMAKFR